MVVELDDVEFVVPGAIVVRPSLGFVIRDDLPVQREDGRLATGEEARSAIAEVFRRYEDREEAIELYSEREPCAPPFVYPA